MPPVLTTIGLLAVFFATSCTAFSLSELITINSPHPVQKIVAQQNPARFPPFPILEVALGHILGQIGGNATAAENVTIVQGLSSTPRSPPDVSKFVALNERGTPAQCGPSSPCIDGSCCNSVCAGLLRRDAFDKAVGREMRLYALQL